jgi:SAM-dependent methyltransferase
VSHLSDDLVAWIEGWLPPPPARVLDVGCGAGDSTRWLRGAGFEALGIDPRAPAEDGFLRLPLEALPADSRFDGALAIRSLHHVHGLEEGLDRLHAALAPRGRLVLFEFAVENADAAARRWLEARGLEPKLAREGQVTSLDDLRAAIERRFRLLAFEPATYLARDLGHEELAGEEEEAVRRGALKPVGARLAYEASRDA